MRKTALLVVIPILLVTVGLLTARRYSSAKSQAGIYSGTIESEESRIGSTVGGRVIATPIAEGRMVQAGDIIVLLESDQLNANLDSALAAEKQAEDRLRDLEAGPRQQEIEQARAAVEQSENQLRKLRNGSRVEEVAAARAALQQARERLALVKAGPRKEEINRAGANLAAARSSRKLAQTELARAVKLIKDGAIAAQALDQASSAADDAQAREDAAAQVLDELLAGNRPEDIRAAEQAVKQAEANYLLVKQGPRQEDIDAAAAAVRQSRAALANLEAGTRPYQIEQARSALKQAHAQVRQIKVNLREHVVLAPINGQLQVLNVHPGDIIAPGQSVATIIDPRSLFIRIYVSAEGLGNLAVGTKLPVETDSGLRVIGTVEQIPYQAEFTPRNVQTPEERSLQQYAIKIRIPNRGLKLRAGMTADVRLRLGR